MIEVEIRHRLGAFELDAAFRSEGGITALFGRSGSGKTSVVNVIGGLIRPLSGRVVVDGTTLLDTARGTFVAPHRRRCGYVFQEGRLFPHLSVKQNLLYGRWFARGRGPRIDVAHVVDLLGLRALLKRRPASLSGGEKQRVAIGRALLSEPRILLMDEPFASLDEPRKAEVLPYIERLRDEVRIPVVYVSHAMSEVARLASTVVLMAEGRVVGSGAPDQVLGRQAMLQATGPREAAAVLEARIAAHDEAFALSTVTTPAGTLTLPRIAAPVGAAARVMIRSSDVMLATSRPAGLSALNVLEGTVVQVTQETGTVADVELDCSGARLLARITRKSAASLGLEAGVRVFAVIKTVALDERDGRAFGAARRPAG
jgi:molybdate transport system ATP-binding protein